MTEPGFSDAPPMAAGVTEYDKRHLGSYLRLLDAEADNADWAEVARIVFGIDPVAEPSRAKAVHASHLARAQWMRDAGFRDLLNKN